jgi:hypothetical protein
MYDYDKLYDGNAALEGLQTGDVIKAIYDINNEIHYINKEHDIHSILELVEQIAANNVEQSNRDIPNNTLNTNQSRSINKINNVEFPLQYSLLIERLINTAYDINNNTSNVLETNYDVILSNEEDDDNIILDLIHNVDHFLSVGQYWKFDKE